MEQVESLLSLFEMNCNRALLWAQLAKCVPSRYKLERCRELCGGVVWDVLIDGAGPFLKQAGPILERHRLEEKRPSDRAMVGAVNEALIEVEEKLPQYASELVGAREQLLESENALPNG
jgi:hypothetical protein